MSEKTTQTEDLKDDQTLASVSFILGLILVGVAVFVLNTMEKSSDHVQALARAEKYAQQLIDSGFQSSYQDLMDLAPTANRTLASLDQPQILEGGIGLDPWGYPFQYFVNKKGTDSEGQIVVWSGGPDNKFQTEIKKVKELIGNEKKVRFSGDDFGKVISFKLSPEFANK
jgi:hypothetical protein